MRKAKKVKVGSIVQVPVRQFAPLRQGWNGWIFEKGIVRVIGKSEKYGKCYKVEFPARGYNHTNRKETITKWFIADYCFETDLYWQNELMKHPREYYERGNYNEATEFFIDQGIVEDIWEKETPLMSL